MNERLLRAAFVRAGKTIKQMAGLLGISCAALYRRLNGKTEFQRSEIAAIRRICVMSNDETEEIFFA